MTSSTINASVAAKPRLSSVSVLTRVNIAGANVVGPAAQMVNAVVLEVTIWENATSKLWPGEHGGQARARSLYNFDLHVDFLALLSYHLLDGVGKHGPGGGGKEAADIGRWAEPGLLGHGLLLGPLLSLE